MDNLYHESLDKKGESKVLVHPFLPSMFDMTCTVLCSAVVHGLTPSDPHINELYNSSGAKSIILYDQFDPTGSRNKS